MKTALSQIRETILYGKNGRGDERIRLEKDRYGYYSFAAVLFILWFAMAVGLLAGNMTIAVFACALFITGIQVLQDQAHLSACPAAYCSPASVTESPLQRSFFSFTASRFRSGQNSYV